MEEDQQFCLRWNNHQSTLISVFDTLLENGTLVDCTLAAEGKFLKAHKVVLSACSPYFATLLSQQYDKHPIFILKDVKFQELRAMMDYMYRGEVNISQDQLGALLKAAESLQIKGLSDNRSSNNTTQKNDTKQQVPVSSKCGLTIEHKRPLKHPALDIDSDVAGSREGSTSPTSRKRKKVRRRSTEGVLSDNHDHHSNSSSQSLPQAASTSGSINNLATSVVNVTKKTELQQQIDIKTSEIEQHGLDENEQDNQEDIDEEEEEIVKPNPDVTQQEKKEMLVEPKNEYDDGQDEPVEDLTIEDEELLDEMDPAGPSHGGESSSQGYPQWQVERSQDQESFMSTQEAGSGQHRDAQDSSKKKLFIKPSTIKTTTAPSITTNENDSNNDNERKTIYPMISNCGLLENENISLSIKNDYAVLSFKLKNKQYLLNDSNNSEINNKVKIITIKNNVDDKEHNTDDNDDDEDEQDDKDIDVEETDEEPSEEVDQCHHRSDSDVIVKTSSSSSNTNNASSSLNYNNNKTFLKSNFKRIKNTIYNHPPDSSSGSSNALGALSVLGSNIGTKEETNNYILTNKSPIINQTSSFHPRIKYSKPKNLVTATNAQQLHHQHNIIKGIVTLQQQLQSTPILNRNLLQSGYQKLKFNREHDVSSVSVTNLSTNSQNNDDNNIHSSIISDFDNYAEIDDIELPDGSQIGFNVDEYSQSQDGHTLKSHSSSHHHSTNDDYKIMSGSMKFEYLSDSATSANEEGRQYVCRHCGKRYRWKSTLRRHENVECGGKEPLHQCPHCPYKAKQRGNLGVHIRKHHAAMPPLESRRTKNRTTI